MKFLGWMHKKIRQHSIDPLKDVTNGNCFAFLSEHSQTVDDPIFYPKSSQNTKPLKQNHKECPLFLSAPNSKKEEDLKEVLSDEILDFFHGFLSIGTLGSKLILSGPPTPTFGTSFTNTGETEPEEMVMENDLKVLNDELDKFLEASVKEEGCDDSSRRNSYVSIVSLNNKQMEEYEKTETFPLQGYLFGSSIELPVSREGVKKEKASLRELLQLTKIDEGYSELNYEKDNMKDNKKYKAATYLMKKMLKRLHNSSKSSIKSTSSDTSHSVSTKSKIHKVLRILHRKIHPESSKESEEINKSCKNMINSTVSQNGHDKNEDYSLSESIKKFYQGSMSEGVQCPNYSSSLPRNGISSSIMSGNKEHWIRTDEEYLVLEL